MMLIIRMAHFFAMILMIPSRGHRQIPETEYDEGDVKIWKVH
jgi:hypothetical protein